jgi:Mn-containing catalase
MQEVLGGQYGEITVAMQYGFQAWNSHIPGKYRDLLFGIGAEEFGHVEMLAVMIAQLLEKAPVEQSEAAAASDPVLGAVMGGMDVQHAIVAGAGARPVDSNGNPWQGSYITASGNLLADFTANANAEMQGRLQVARIYNMTDDKGVRDMLRFNLARDTVHQQQWLAAIEMLKADGLETLPVPSTFGTETEYNEHGNTIWGLSDGTQGPEALPKSFVDGTRDFEYLLDPQPLGPIPDVPATDPLLYATVDGGSRLAEGGTAPATGGGGLVEKAKEVLTGTEPGTHTKS